MADTEIQAYEEGVIRALEQVLGRALDGVGTDTRLFDELNLDSTAVLEVLMVIEDELQVSFDPESLQLEDLGSVGALAQYIRGAEA